MFEYLKVSKQTQYNIILRYTQLSKYAMTIAQSPDSTRHPLNIQIWFQFDPNVHGLSTNVSKTYIIQCTKYVYIWTFKKCLSHAKNFFNLLVTYCFRWLKKWQFF